MNYCTSLCYEDYISFAKALEDMQARVKYHAGLAEMFAGSREVERFNAVAEAILPLRRQIEGTLKMLEE